MPFEPRLFNDAEFAAPIDKPSGSDVALPVDMAAALPPELQALAEQLAADADHLAERYPAHERIKQVDVAPIEATSDLIAVRRRRMRWGGAAAAVAIAVIGGWRVAGFDPSIATPVSNKSPIVAVQQAKSPAQPKLADDKNGNSNLTPGAFGGLTGAEQEAVLDLMQDQPAGQAQLSI